MECLDANVAVNVTSGWSESFRSQDSNQPYVRNGCADRYV